MELTQEIKNKIIQEYTFWEDKQYQNKTKKERDELGQFFTPPNITIKMLEKIPLNGKSIYDMTILDPTVGAGGLLAAAIIAGADPKKCYGNEYDADILTGCKERLIPLGVPDINLHQGDATIPECISLESFNKNYSWTEIQLKHGLISGTIDLW